MEKRLAIVIAVEIDAVTASAPSNMPKPMPRASPRLWRLEARLTRWNGGRWEAP